MLTNVNSLQRWSFAIYLTRDHAGGNEEMVKKYKAEVANIPLDVYGGDERIQALTKKVRKCTVKKILIF